MGIVLFCRQVKKGSDNDPKFMPMTSTFILERGDSYEESGNENAARGRIGNVCGPWPASSQDDSSLLGIGPYGDELGEEDTTVPGKSSTL